MLPTYTGSLVLPFIACSLVQCSDWSELWTYTEVQYSSMLLLWRCTHYVRSVAATGVMCMAHSSWESSEQSVDLHRRGVWHADASEHWSSRPVVKQAGSGNVICGTKREPLPGANPLSLRPASSRSSSSTIPTPSVHTTTATTFSAVSVVARRREAIDCVPPAGGRAWCLARSTLLQVPPSPAELGAPSLIFCVDVSVERIWSVRRVSSQIQVRALKCVPVWTNGGVVLVWALYSSAWSDRYVLSVFLFVPF
jgi:hypothetical protein